MRRSGFGSRQSCGPTAASMVRGCGVNTGKRLRNWPRFGRIVFWWFVAVLLIGFGYHVAETPIVEVPARGLGDRDLFRSTLVLSDVVADRPVRARRLTPRS